MKKQIFSRLPSSEEDGTGTAFALEGTSLLQLKPVRASVNRVSLALEFLKYLLQEIHFSISVLVNERTLRHLLNHITT